MDTPIVKERPNPKKGIRKHITFNGVCFLEALLYHRDMIYPITDELYKKYQNRIRMYYDDLFEPESEIVLEQLQEICPDSVYVECIEQDNPVPYKFDASSLLDIASGYMIWNSRDGGRGFLYDFYRQKGTINSEEHRRGILTEIKDCYETEDYHGWERSDLKWLRQYIMRAPIGQILDDNHTLPV